MSDNDSFMASINAFVDKAKANQQQVVRVAGFKILAKLVDMSPVGNPDVWAVNAHNVYARETHNLFAEAFNDDLGSNKGRIRRMGQKKLKETFPSKAPENYTGGRFRGNWQVSFEQPADGVLDVDKKTDPGGNVTLSKGKEVIESFKVGTKAIYFTNNVPYAYRLEFGHSKQAPNGMVRITAEEAARYFAESAQELDK